MNTIATWARSFPIAAIVIGIVILLLVRKRGPGSSLNWAYILVFLMIVASVAASVWGFKNVRPPQQPKQTR